MIFINKEEEYQKINYIPCILNKTLINFGKRKRKRLGTDFLDETFRL